MRSDVDGSILELIDALFISMFIDSVVSNLFLKKTVQLNMLHIKNVCYIIYIKYQNLYYKGGL